MKKDEKQTPELTEIAYSFLTEEERAVLEKSKDKIQLNK